MRERAGSPFALSRPQKHSSGPFRQQKEPVCVCVSLGEISRERRVRDFPAGDFIRFLVTRSAIERRRRQWDRMIMSFVYIYGNPLRASERESACRAIRMQPACLLCPTKSLPLFGLSLLDDLRAAHSHGRWRNSSEDLVGPKLRSRPAIIRARFSLPS